MLAVFNSNVTTKFVQLYYFLTQSIGGDKRYCVLSFPNVRSPWNAVPVILHILLCQSCRSPEPSPKKFPIGGLCNSAEALRLLGGAWHYKIDQNSTYSVSRFNWGGLELCLGEQSPPVAMGLP